MWRAGGKNNVGAEATIARQTDGNGPLAAYDGVAIPSASGPSSPPAPSPSGSQGARPPSAPSSLELPTWPNSARYLPTEDLYMHFSKQATNSSAIMQLFHDKIPLTLLLDLADADHIQSRALFRNEAADLTWLRDCTDSPALVAGKHP